MRCPKCAKGKIYASFLTLVDECSECGLKIKENDSADGPAYSAMFIMSFLTSSLFFGFDFDHRYSILVNSAIWLPFIAIGSLICLKLIKPIFISVQYKYKIMGFGKEK